MLLWLDSSAEGDEMAITTNDPIGPRKNGGRQSTLSRSTSARGTVVVPIAHGIMHSCLLPFSNDKDFELARYSETRSKT